jgi:hypothetical protein
MVGGALSGHWGGSITQWGKARSVPDRFKIMGKAEKNLSDQCGAGSGGCGDDCARDECTGNECAGDEFAKDSCGEERCAHGCSAPENCAAEKQGADAAPASAVACAGVAVSGANTETTAAKPRSDRRKTVIDRRVGADRRHKSAAETSYNGPERRVNDDRRGDTGLERRRGPGRRRSDDRKAAEEGEMTAEQFEFVMAIEMYKKLNKRLYPTWTEVLEVMGQLGYRKVEKRQIKLDNVPEPALAKVA